MKTGRILYYLLWPLIWFYSPLNIRVRVIIAFEDEYLQVINWFGSGKWSLPGGGMKFGEKPEESGIREIFEELGLILSRKSIKMLTIEPLVLSYSGLLYRNHYMFVRLDKKPNLSLSKEITDTRWVKISKNDLPQQISNQILTL